MLFVGPMLQAEDLRAAVARKGEKVSLIAVLEGAMLAKFTELRHAVLCCV
jgi:hypothetical protein